MENMKVEPCVLRDGGRNLVFNATAGDLVTLQITELVGRLRIRSAEYPIGNPMLLESPALEITFEVLRGSHELKIDFVFSDLFEGEGELRESCAAGTLINRLSPDNPTHRYSICAS